MVQRLLVFLFLLPFSICFSHFDYFPSDNNFDYKHALPNDTYHRYCRTVYSQNGEDGIIEQILKELGIESGSFCEFGASDGIAGSNTYNLIVNHNFSGMAIEANPERFQKCRQNYRSIQNVQLFQGFVIYDDVNYDLNAWLKKGQLPYDFDVLSIDIDCDDYYVWERLSDFKPKIVIFEVNSYRDPVFDELPRIRSTEYNIDLLELWHPSRIALGCSFISAVKLGLQKGYIPLAFTGNLIFLRRDLADRLKEFPYVLSDDPYDYIPLYDSRVLYGSKWYTNTALILNAAIRDYFIQFKRKTIDIDWINMRMRQIIENGEDD